MATEKGGHSKLGALSHVIPRLIASFLALEQGVHSMTPLTMHRFRSAPVFE